MPNRDRVLDFVTRVEVGDVPGAFEEFDGEEVVIRENTSPPSAGQAANRERERDFVGAICEVQENRAESMVIDGNQVAINGKAEYTFENGSRLRSDPVALQTWERDRWRGVGRGAAGVQPLSVPEAARTRRSIRRYAPEPVPHEELAEILALTGLAPSANNLQPWRFLVVEDAETRAALQEAANGQKQVGSAPAVVVLYSDMHDTLARAEELVHPGVGPERIVATAREIRESFAALTEAEREEIGAGQAYIALGYLVLLARSFGYDTSPMLGFDAARVKALLGLPDHVRISALVAIGVAAEEGFPHHRFRWDEIVTFR